jgi:hypothetical protein
MDQREERIVVETSRLRISGLLNLPVDGYRSRLTDYLNAGERTFLPLTDVEVSRLDGGGPPYHRPFIALSLSQIVFAMPANPDGALDP